MPRTLPLTAPIPQDEKNLRRFPLDQFAPCRIVTGFGLADELGAALLAAIAIEDCIFSLALMATAALQEPFGKYLTFLDR